MVEEPGSDAMRRLVRNHPRQVSSLIALVEVRRAALGASIEAAAVVAALDALTLIPVDMAIATRAAEVGPPRLRSLDAIHLATAMELGSDLEALVTYDHRLASAARALGLPVSSPT